MTWRVASYAVWAALALAGAGVQFVGATRARIDTAGRFLRRLTLRPMGRVLLALGWMWCGWHFFAR